MAKRPWEEITWSEELQQRIYRSWGDEYVRKQKLDSAANYCSKTLEINKNDKRAFYCRSLCASEVAKTGSALDDALAALKIDNKYHPVNLQVCDAYYEQNAFEKTKFELVNMLTKYSGKKTEPFKNRIDIVAQNLLDSTGDSAGQFLSKNQKHFSKFAQPEIGELLGNLKVGGNCDCLRSLAEDGRKISKRLRIVAKSKLNERIYNQVYLKEAWKDVLFLKNLKSDKRLLLPQTKRTTLHVKKVVDDSYQSVHNFLKMLQARDPLYNHRQKVCPDQNLAYKVREKHLFQVQNQTRRTTFKILDKVKSLREKGNIEELLDFVEKEMGDYIELKTHRVMPRKFEFLNEIYNITALAFCDKLTVPENAMELAVDKRILILLDLPVSKDHKKSIQYVFGDKSTYEAPDAPNYDYIIYKKKTNRLENRLQYAKYPIEKCYLYHELSRNHLNQHKLQECRAMGRKVIEEAKKCQNYVWMFLGYLIICKSNAIENKVEEIDDSIFEAIKIAKRLKNTRIVEFLETCSKVNQMNIELKQSLSEILISKRKEKSKLKSLARISTSEVKTL